MRRPEVALTTASVRVDTLSLRQAFSIWKFTVRLLMFKIVEISGEVFPRADQVRHSNSRSFSATWRDQTSLRAPPPHGLLDDGGENLEIDRLGDIIIGTEAPALQFTVAIRARRQKNERHDIEPRCECRQALHHLETRH